MKKGEETRQAILGEASKLASRIGLGALTIGLLASKMKMSKSGLFAHFGSKEALQVQVLEYTANTFRSEVVRPAFKSERGEPRIRQLFENWLSWINDSNLECGCLFVQTATEFDDKPGPVRDCIEDNQREWLAGLAESARRAIKEDHFRRDVDPDVFAFEFYSMLLGYHHSHRMLRDPKAEKHVRSTINNLIEKSRDYN